MSNYATLKQAIQSVIKTNGNEEITGAVLQNALLSIIDSIGANYTFAGVATPQTNAGSPDQNVFYIGGEGTYTNFGSAFTVKNGELGLFMYNGNWINETINDGTLRTMLREGLTEASYTISSSTTLTDFEPKIGDIYEVSLISITGGNNVSINTGDTTVYLFDAGDKVRFAILQQIANLVVNPNGSTCEIKVKKIVSDSDFSVNTKRTGGYATIGAFTDKIKKAYITINAVGAPSPVPVSIRFLSSGAISYKSIAECDIGVRTLIEPTGFAGACDMYVNNSDGSKYEVIFETLSVDDYNREINERVDGILEENPQLSYQKTYRSISRSANFNFADIGMKGGDILQYSLVGQVGSTHTIDVYIFKSDNTYTRVVHNIPIGSVYTYLIDEDDAFIRFYDTSNVGGFTVMLGRAESMSRDFNSNYPIIAQFAAPSSTTYVNLHLVTQNNSIFPVWARVVKGGENTYQMVGRISTATDLGIKLPEDGDDNSLIAIYLNTTEVVAGTCYAKVVESLEAKNIAFSYANILILGDSYSQQKRWVNAMVGYLPTPTVVNLGVTNCTIRDKYADRVTYPYTSRPVSSDNSGNHNTMACQIQKLKRLMAGTDLDAGETQLYVNESDYPNIIILEGGMNDNVDSEEKEAAYSHQLSKEVTAYYKRKDDEDASEGTVWIKTPIDEVDRTSFAGAYRYVIEELMDLFPKAQIFLTTASTMGYWTYDVVSRRYAQALQQLKCARLFSCVAIDWNAEGNINCINDYPTGSGTQADPYIVNATTEQTTDLMHPNEKGAEKYGRLAALVIQRRFLNFEEFL